MNQIQAQKICLEILSQINLSSIHVAASLINAKRQAYFLRTGYFIGKELRGGIVEHSRRNFDPCIHKETERVRCDDCEIKFQCSLYKFLFPFAQAGRRKTSPWFLHFNNIEA